MNSQSTGPFFRTHRCAHQTRTGRRCRSLAIEDGCMFCPRHSHAQPDGPDDFSHILMHYSDGFHDADGVRRSLAMLYASLASNAITPRRASVLAQITGVILRTLPMIQADLNAPHPEWRGDVARLQVQLKRILADAQVSHTIDEASQTATVTARVPVPPGFQATPEDRRKLLEQVQNHLHAEPSFPAIA